MMTSTMMTVIADLPFFILFQLVLFIVSPWLSWIAPVATILMLLPGFLLQKKLAELANKNQHSATKRHSGGKHSGPTGYQNDAGGKPLSAAVE